MKHVFVTYGDDNYRESKERITREAKEFGFDKVYTFGPEDLSEEFKEKTKEVLSQSRGGGYWIWKSYCMRKAMSEANFGDAVVYCDAGCSVKKDQKELYYKYLDLIKDEHNVLSFTLSQPFHDTYRWTKKDVFDYFGITPEHKLFRSAQLMGGVVVMIKTDSTVSLLDEYYNIAITQPKLFDDSHVSENYPGLVENRHDQAVFSLLRYLRGTVLHYNNPDVLVGPLQATRLRS